MLKRFIMTLFLLLSVSSMATEFAAPLLAQSSDVTAEQSREISEKCSVDSQGGNVGNTIICFFAAHADTIRNSNLFASLSEPLKKLWFFLVAIALLKMMFNGEVADWPRQIWPILAWSCLGYLLAFGWHNFSNKNPMVELYEKVEAVALSLVGAGTSGVDPVSRSYSEFRRTLDQYDTPAVLQSKFISQDDCKFIQEQYWPTLFQPHQTVKGPTTGQAICVEELIKKAVDDGGKEGYASLVRLSNLFGRPMETSGGEAQPASTGYGGSTIKEINSIIQSDQNLGTFEPYTGVPFPGLFSKMLYDYQYYHGRLLTHFHWADKILTMQDAGVECGVITGKFEACMVQFEYKWAQFGMILSTVGYYLQNYFMFLFYFALQVVLFLNEAIIVLAMVLFQIVPAVIMPLAIFIYGLFWIAVQERGTAASLWQLYRSKFLGWAIAPAVLGFLSHFIAILIKAATGVLLSLPFAIGTIWCLLLAIIIMTMVGVVTWFLVNKARDFSEQVLSKSFGPILDFFMDISNILRKAIAAGLMAGAGMAFIGVKSAMSGVTGAMNLAGKASGGRTTNLANRAASSVAGFMQSKRINYAARRANYGARTIEKDHNNDPRVDELLDGLKRAVIPQLPGSPGTGMVPSNQSKNPGLSLANDEWKGKSSADLFNRKDQMENMLKDRISKSDLGADDVLAENLMNANTRLSKGGLAEDERNELEKLRDRMQSEVGFRQGVRENIQNVAERARDARESESKIIEEGVTAAHKPLIDLLTEIRDQGRKEEPKATGAAAMAEAALGAMGLDAAAGVAQEAMGMGKKKKNKEDAAKAAQAGGAGSAPRSGGSTTVNDPNAWHEGKLDSEAQDANGMSERNPGPAIMFDDPNSDAQIAKLQSDRANQSEEVAQEKKKLRDREKVNNSESMSAFIKGYTKKTFDATVKEVQNSKLPGVKGFNTVTEGYGDVALTFATAARNSATNASGSVTNAINEFKENNEGVMSLGSEIGAVGSMVADRAGDVRDNVVEKATAVRDGARDKVSSMVEGTKSAAANAWQRSGGASMTQKVREDLNNSYAARISSKISEFKNARESKVLDQTFTQDAQGNVSVGAVNTFDNNVKTYQDQYQVQIREKEEEIQRERAFQAEQEASISEAQMRNISSQMETMQREINAKNEQRRNEFDPAKKKAIDDQISSLTAEMASASAPIAFRDSQIQSSQAKTRSLQNNRDQMQQQHEMMQAFIREETAKREKILDAANERVGAGEERNQQLKVARLARELDKNKTVLTSFFARNPIKTVHIPQVYEPGTNLGANLGRSASIVDVEVIPSGMLASGAAALDSGRPALGAGTQALPAAREREVDEGKTETEREDITNRLATIIKERIEPIARGTDLKVFFEYPKTIVIDNSTSVTPEVLAQIIDILESDLRLDIKIKE